MSDLNTNVLENDSTIIAITAAKVTDVAESTGVDALVDGKLIAFDDVFNSFDRSRNPRKEKRYSDNALKILARNIHVNGLQSPFELNRRTNGKLSGLKGHRRAAAIKLLQTVGLEKDQYGPAVAADPVRFKKVKCRVLEGLSPKQEMDILLDHGDVVGQDRGELLLTAIQGTRYGFTHAEIAVKCKMTRSNYSNGLARIIAMPDCVGEMYLAEGEDAIPVTQEALKVLYAAFQEDEKAGTPVKIAGPKFQAAWEKFLKDGSVPPIRMIDQKTLRGVASSVADPDIRAMLQAIIDGKRDVLGETIDNLSQRLVDLSTVNTGFTRVEEGIPTTVRDFVPAEV